MDTVPIWRLWVNKSNISLDSVCADSGRSTCLLALANHPTNTLAALQEAERTLITELELLQMRMQQNISHENHQSEKEWREKNILDQISQGDIQEIQALYPDFFQDVLMASEIMTAFLLPRYRDVATHDTKTCFCGENTPSSFYHARLPTLFTFLHSCLQQGLTSRRTRLFRLLQLMKKAEKWYKNAAVDYSRRWLDHLRGRLQLLKACVTISQEGFYTSLHNDDWETLVHTTCSSYITRMRTYIAAVTLLDSWIEMEHDRIQEEILTPKFENVLAIPSIFRNHTGQQTASFALVSDKCRASWESCCVTFISQFILNTTVWEDNSDTFWIPNREFVITKNVKISDVSSVNDSSEEEEEEECRGVVRDDLAIDID